MGKCVNDVNRDLLLDGSLGGHITAGPWKLEQEMSRVEI
jgi:hypothetical protein